MDLKLQAVTEQSTAAISPPPEAVKPDTPVAAPDPIAEAVATAEAAAAKFYAEQRSEQQTTERPRGPDGKFVSTKQQSAPESAPQTTPLIDPVWAHAAEQFGFSKDEIAGFRNDSEVQEKIESRRIERQVRAIRELGIRPDDYAAFQQWRQQPNTPSDAAPRGDAPPSPSALPEFKIPIDEKDVDPALLPPLKAVEQHVNTLTKTLTALQAENEKLRKAQESMDQHLRQSADAAARAQSEARWGAEWDKAAKSVPGFTEVMGVPTEARRLADTDPNHPQVVLWNMFNTQFQGVWQKYAAVLGPENVPLHKAVNDTFAALKSSLARFGGTGGNGTNGASALGPGSVVRADPRVSQAEIYANDMDGELLRIRDNARRAYGNTGGVNPFWAIDHA